MTADDAYKLIFKQSKIHDRFSVGLKFIKSPLKKKLMLYTFAQDSIKVWNVITSDNSFAVTEEKKIDGNFCGIQSFDVQNDGQLISVIGVESTLHKILLDDNFNATITNVNAGLMEMWFTQILPNSHTFFTTSFSGFLKLLDAEGNTIKTSPFDKVKLILASNSGNHIAIGNSQGWISIVNAETLLTLFSIEAHACKIRCLQFSNDDTQLLSGSDDKIVKLYTLSETKGTLAKNFCGHRGSVMQLDVDKSSAGERFASVGLDNRLIVWDVASGDKLHIFYNDSADFFRGVAFSFDGRFIATSTDESVLLVYRIPQSKNYIPEDDEFLENQLDAEKNNIFCSINDENNHHELASPANSYNSDKLLQAALPSLSPASVQSPDEKDLQQPLSNRFEEEDNENHSGVETSTPAGPASPSLSNATDEGALMDVDDRYNNQVLEKDNVYHPLINDDETAELEDVDHDEEETFKNVSNKSQKMRFEHSDVEENIIEEKIETSPFANVSKQHPVINYQEAFEQQELEMQLGID